MGYRAKGLKRSYFKLREDGRAGSVDNHIVRHHISKETPGWRNGQTVSERLLDFCSEASPQKHLAAFIWSAGDLKTAGIKT